MAKGMVCPKLWGGSGDDAAVGQALPGASDRFGALLGIRFGCG